MTALLTGCSESVSLRPLDETTTLISSAGNDELNHLPIKMDFRRSAHADILLELSNPSKTEQKLTSNLKRVLDYVYDDFPFMGAIQLRDAQTKTILLDVQRPTGWYCPGVKCSFMDIQKNNAVVMTSELSLPGGGKLHYPLKLKRAIRSALMQCSGVSDSAKEVRLSLALILLDAKGDKVDVSLISGWFPVPAE